MELNETITDGVTILEPRGRMDTVGAKPFGDRMGELIGLGHDRIVIDLKNIQYISSAGFRAPGICRVAMGQTVLSLQHSRMAVG